MTLSDAPVPRWNIWWRRNWRWFVPTLGCLFPLLVGILCVSLLLAGLTTALRPAPLYQEALRRAQNDPDVVGCFGRPITARGRLKGSMTERKERRRGRRCTVPLAGPRGRAVPAPRRNQAGERLSFAVLTVTAGARRRARGPAPGREAARLQLIRPGRTAAG
jgi:hypothetical protein